MHALSYTLVSLFGSRFQNSPVRYLRLEIQYALEYQRPMHRLMTESDAIKREWLVTWKVGVEDGIAYTLFYVVGDREPYESALCGVETMESYDITPVRDEAFYAFIRGQETDRSRQFYTAFEQPTLMIVPPVAYRPHGIVLFDVVGEPAALEQVRSAKCPENRRIRCQSRNICHRPHFTPARGTHRGTRSRVLRRPTKWERRGRCQRTRLCPEHCIEPSQKSRGTAC